MGALINVGLIENITHQRGMMTLDTKSRVVKGLDCPLYVSATFITPTEAVKMTISRYPVNFTSKSGLIHDGSASNKVNSER
jgi:hypothetical protein